MIYKVKKQLEFEGREYFPGELIKLTDEQASEYKGKIIKAKMITKVIN